MKKRTLFVIAVLISLLIGYLYVAEPLEIVDTGTKCWSKEIWIGFPARKVTSHGYVEGNGELMESKISTARLPGDESEIIRLGDCGFIPYGERLYGPYFGKWWWEVNIVKDGNTIPVIRKDGTFDDNYIRILDGVIGEQPWPGVHSNGDLPWPHGTMCDAGIRDWYFSSTIIPDYGRYFEVPTLEFRILGPNIGRLEAKLKFNGFVWSDDVINLPPVWMNHCSLKNTDITLIEDTAELVPGVGTLYIQPNPLAPPGTNTDYYFEEGHELTFEVSTGFDGESGNNWDVYLYNQYGQSVEGDRTVYEVGGSGTSDFPLSLGNNLNHKAFRYTIQPGDFVEGVNSKWHLALFNSIINVHEVFYFTLYEGGFADIPGTAEITFTSGDPINTKYYVGDTISMTVEATNNPNSGRRIQYFSMMAYYGDTRPENLIYDNSANPKEVPAYAGSTYSTTFALVPIRVGQLTIIAWASDEIMLPGGWDMRGVYIHDDLITDTYTLTVVVKDNQDRGVGNAKVDVSGVGNLLTDASGVAVFANLPKGRYQVSAIKGGLGEDSTVVSLSSDMTVDLKLGLALDLISIGVSLLIFAIIALIALFVPMPPLHKKIIVIVGVIVAIFVFLILSGMIVILG